MWTRGRRPSVWSTRCNARPRPAGHSLCCRRVQVRGAKECCGRVPVDLERAVLVQLMAMVRLQWVFRGSEGCKWWK
eukprot:15483194-Alexandrium_andersonii.AAC.2